MLFKEDVIIKANVHIVARERGKKVIGSCRDSHNIFVNLGRQYITEVISPQDASFNSHQSDLANVRVVRSIGMGIGSTEQTILVDTVYPTFAVDYPGGATFTDTPASLALAPAYLERPVKVTGTAGPGVNPGVWMKDVAVPPAYTTTPVHSVTYTTLFSTTDFQLGGAYPAVPLSEVGLFLSDQDPSITGALNSDDVYDYAGHAEPPAGVYSETTRPKLIAYNGFAPITKTASIDLQVSWELQV